MLTAYRRAGVVGVPVSLVQIASYEILLCSRGGPSRNHMRLQ